MSIGSGPQRPFNHGWRLAQWQQDPVAPAACLSQSAPQALRQAIRLYAVTDPLLNQQHGRCVEQLHAWGMPCVQRVCQPAVLRGGTRAARCSKPLHSAGTCLGGWSCSRGRVHQHPAAALLGVVLFQTTAKQRVA